MCMNLDVVLCYECFSLSALDSLLEPLLDKEMMLEV